MSGPDFSNVVRLSLREWAAVGLCAAGFSSSRHQSSGSGMRLFEPGPDYRMPYDLSNDYWLYDRYARRAAQTHGSPRDRRLGRVGAIRDAASKRSRTI